MTDEQRTDSLGCYGGRFAGTPHLDMLAKTGVLFTRAVTPAPVCTPARTALLTGRYPSENGVWWNDRSRERLGYYLTATFARAGYQTASIGKQHYGSRNPAFEMELDMVLTERVDYFSYDARFPAEQFDVVQYPPEPYPWILGGRFPGPVEETAEAGIVETAMDWLDRRDKERPFLLRVSFNGPHTPVTVPEPYAALADETALADDLWGPPAMAGEPRWIHDCLRRFSDAGRLSPKQKQKARRYYYGYVSFIDSQCGRLLDYLKRHNLDENTIVIFMSDHGTHLGDHGLIQKQTFYESVVNVPFLVSCPAYFQVNRSIRTPVETRSLLPTLLDFAKFPHDTDADSLLPSLLTGEEPPARPVFSEFTLGSFGVRHHDPLIMVRRGDWKLSLCMTEPDEDGTLVSLDADPLETTNLYADPSHAGIREELRSLIHEHLRRHTPHPD